MPIGNELLERARDARFQEDERKAIEALTNSYIAAEVLGFFELLDPLRELLKERLNVGNPSLFNFALAHETLIRRGCSSGWLEEVIEARFQPRKWEIKGGGGSARVGLARDRIDNCGILQMLGTVTPCEKVSGLDIARLSERYFDLLPHEANPLPGQVVTGGWIFSRLGEVLRNTVMYNRETHTLTLHTLHHNPDGARTGRKKRLFETPVDGAAVKFFSEPGERQFTIEKIRMDGGMVAEVHIRPERNPDSRELVMFDMRDQVFTVLTPSSRRLSQKVGSHRKWWREVSIPDSDAPGAIHIQHNLSRESVNTLQALAGRWSESNPHDEFFRESHMDVDRTQSQARVRLTEEQAQRVLQRNQEYRRQAWNQVRESQGLDFSDQAWMDWQDDQAWINRTTHFQLAPLTDVQPRAITLNPRGGHSTATPTTDLKEGEV